MPKQTRLVKQYNMGCCPCCNTPLRRLRSAETQRKHLTRYSGLMSKPEVRFEHPGEKETRVKGKLSVPSARLFMVGKLYRQSPFRASELPCLALQTPETLITRTAIPR